MRIVTLWQIQCHEKSSFFRTSFYDKFYSVNTSAKVFNGYGGHDQ